MLVIITGASSGIGEALSYHYAVTGHTLCLYGRDALRLEKVAAACRQKGATVEMHRADICDASAMAQIGADIVARHGAPDLVIANAGIRIEDPQLEQGAGYVDSAAAQEVMNANYHGTIHTFAPFLQSMIARRSGHLVAISSIGALRATPNSGIYSASKAAVNLWTEALRLKLAPYHVGLTTACSGFVRTAMTADLPFHMPGLLEPEQAATIIANAVTQRRSRITFPWQSALLWGSFSLMPGWLYDTLILLAKKYWPSRTDTSTSSR